MEDYTNMRHVGALRPTSELRSFLSTTFVRGYSAYEIAVQNGYVGTEEEWLESLIGPQGEQGPQGIQGIQGIQGETGNGISCVRLNADYSLTIYFTNGTSINLGNIRGEKGEKGDTGERGPQGYTGETGARGPQGEKGDKGDQGEPAVSPLARVVQTSTGAILFVDDIHGSTYAQIANGQKGDKGDTGERGPQGYPGEKGDPGESFELHACSQDEYDPITRIPTIENPDSSTLYLVPSADPVSPDLFVEWVYVNDNWEMFGSATVEAVTDVQVNGSSIVQDGVALLPVTDQGKLGLVQINSLYGIYHVGNGFIGTNRATDTLIKAGANEYRPVTPYNQHASAFYGLARASGDTTQEASSNAVGTYTDEAKAAIKQMLGITDSTQTVTVSGTEPVITAVANTRYLCGEVTSITITPPASGICEVVFTSGSTVAVLSTTGVTFPEWFDSTSLETNTTYELSIADGRGAVATW